VVVEGRGADSFTETIEEYYSAVPGQGALLLAVCRGKVSEGLDFKGEKARAVFVVGIPFPSFQDTKVKLKQQFNDDAQQRHQRLLQQGAVTADALVLPGGSWYRQQGFRAYNQAIGRCIRNLADYGAVLLVDARFHTDHESANRHREQLSRCGNHTCLSSLLFTILLRLCLSRACLDKPRRYRVNDAQHKSPVLFSQVAALAGQAVPPERVTESPCKLFRGAQGQPTGGGYHHER
jgi:hypothetical protein